MKARNITNLRSSSARRETQCCSNLLRGLQVFLAVPIYWRVRWPLEFATGRFCLSIYLSLMRKFHLPSNFWPTNRESCQQFCGRALLRTPALSLSTGGVFTSALPCHSPRSISRNRRRSPTTVGMAAISPSYPLPHRVSCCFEPWDRHRSQAKTG
jgi:hypothetical protein